MPRLCRRHVSWWRPEDLQPWNTARRRPSKTTAWKAVAATASRVATRPERSHGWSLVGRCPPPRAGGGWLLVGRCPRPRDGGGSCRFPRRSAKACGVARIAAHSRVQHALAVCRHTRACARVGPVTEARPEMQFRRLQSRAGRGRGWKKQSRLAVLCVLA